MTERRHLAGRPANAASARLADANLVIFIDLHPAPYAGNGRKCCNAPDCDVQWATWPAATGTPEETDGATHDRTA
jgi:hypothetical protein